MMKSFCTFLFLAMACVTARAGGADVRKQRHFPKAVPAGDYSGITRVGQSLYVLADDKSATAGFHLVDITIDSLKGDIADVRHIGFRTQGLPNRDEEGVAWCPTLGTLFLAGEADSEVLEYTLDGQQTGRRLNMPPQMRDSYPNNSFEALTYDSVAHRFWTTSECTLRGDGPKPTISRKIGNRLRLQSFDDELQPREAYWYTTDRTVLKDRKRKGQSHVGLSAMAALGDGRIAVLERDIYIAKSKLGSFCHNKIYIVQPSLQEPGDTLTKQLVAEWRTHMNLFRRNLANYEGMCLGPRLSDGRIVLVLCTDSAHQYAKLLRDWFRTVVLPK
jgi:hypothetical protein